MKLGKPLSMVKKSNDEILKGNNELFFIRCDFFKNNFPGKGLKKGMLGAIIHIYNEPSPEYEIAFCDDNGETLVCITLTLDCFSAVNF
ncbi:hypothetical protein PEC302107_37600 [Pectobacterium araliae]|uniref:DUF4926 domain-containing protein n=1 Tax=Pectobacterium araliae TaxID=3073862 RepID=A0AAN0MKT1_9GAMM|nr:hypothetical protein PEC302110_13200 [Pectobacterium sp. MAFF 302110]GKW22031.1 hypothetical protein PEC302107_37600 [Pectobacterium carotovorum subsp. carotovorum]